MEVTLEDVSNLLEKAVADLEKKSNQDHKKLRKDIQESTKNESERLRADAEAYKQRVDKEIEKRRREEKEKDFKRYAKSLLEFRARVPDMLSIQEIKDKLLEAYPDFIKKNLTEDGLDVFLTLSAQALEEE